MTAPVWVCHKCGKAVACDTDGVPMDWENEEGEAGPLLCYSVCEDWPRCEVKDNATKVE